MTFNLINGSYKPYKKPNDTLLYIKKNSNHPPQIIKKLPKTINDRLCKNSSNAEIFHASKVEYEAASKNTGYKNADFKYNLVNKNNSRRNRQKNIIWLNAPLSQAMSANVAKRFLDLLVKHFPPNNQLHKIFNKNTRNVGSIIKSHSKKLTNAKNNQTKDCNCRKRENARWKVNVDLKMSFTNV